MLNKRKLILSALAGVFIFLVVTAVALGAEGEAGKKIKLLLVKPCYEEVEEFEALKTRDCLEGILKRTGLFNVVENKMADKSFFSWKKSEKQPFLEESIISLDLYQGRQSLGDEPLLHLRWDLFYRSIGRITGADIVFTAEITGLGDFYACRLRAYDAVREKSLGSIYEKSEAGEELNPFAVRLTWKLLRKIYAKPVNIAAGISINTADAQVLMLLPGMDAESAGKIISYREANGYYPDIEGLGKAGIKPKLLKKIESRIIIEE